MLFKDRAQHIVARWECLRDEDDITTLAALTAVALSRVPDVPEEILTSLDGLMSFARAKRGKRIHHVLVYLRELATANFRPQTEKC